MPNNFTEEFYNFSIILPYSSSSYSNRIFLHISYDKLEFLTKYKQSTYISPVIPLFQVNPYKYIKENSLNSSNKFFYIYLISLYLFLR